MGLVWFCHVWPFVMFSLSVSVFWMSLVSVFSISVLILVILAVYSPRVSFFFLNFFLFFIFYFVLASCVSGVSSSWP